jgi:hypothetical protein
VLRHEAGHLILDPIFASEYYQDDESDCFLAVDIDDCDCKGCIKDRGPIPKYTTLSIGLVAGKQKISQRLTLDEATQLADTLSRYVKVLKDLELVGEGVDLA